MRVVGFAFQACHKKGGVGGTIDNFNSIMLSNYLIKNNNKDGLVFPRASSRGFESHIGEGTCMFICMSKTGVFCAHACFFSRYVCHVSPVSFGVKWCGVVWYLLHRHLLLRPNLRQLTTILQPACAI